MKSIFVLLFCVITCIYAEEVDFLDNSGEWAVYVDTDEELTIYSWGGKPLAYLDDNFDIYGFNGRYLGWFENGIMYDTDGYPFACVEEAYSGFAPFKPFKAFKEFQPFKSFKKIAKMRPYTKSNFGNISAELYLNLGRQ
ncbi:4-fold beta flower protein [uncultured Campylobacter sp.]|uniref:4-fold beta flower protein n=1 Tax=uncultured Campylobacter sp. TaxID=218934 RepID=UPI0028E9871D|nr:hypothetical protein [uncultured Campylobacter sp.]